ncbi:MAG TPA: type II toxin-antitoxin system VapC family toxin [Solirubrobacterales bacterium]|nr:type II toxin-antitoxin system VapC family toxin [Solirubrobacterales bacterium]
MPAISVVSDANIVLKWFHAEGEEEVESARGLLDAHKERRVALSVLDLTVYEVGNALMRGRAGASAEQAATVIEALAEVCPALRPSPEEMRVASELAERHDLTLYDAAYAAVAQSHSAELVTLDRALLDAGLGRRPSDLTEAIAAATPAAQR